MEAPEVLHIVLINLEHPEDAQDLIDDALSELWFARRSLYSFTPGSGFEMGRPEVDGAYDVAFVMKFEDSAEYREYLTSREHARLQRVWKPHVTRLRVIDIQRVAATNDDAWVCKPQGSRGPRRVLE